MPLHWPGKNWSRPAVEILRRRNFRNLWIASLFTDVSGHVRTVGVAWLTLELTDSQFWVGLTLGSVAIPVIALGLLSGAVVDQLPRRSIITLSQLILGCLLFFMFLLTASDTLLSWHLPVFILGVGVVLAFWRPARGVYMVELVDRRQILTGNSLMAVSNNAGEIIAPALAGFLIARYGPDPIFIIAGAGYVLAAGLILRTRSGVSTVPPTDRGRLYQEVREGVSYAISNRRVLALLAIAATAVFGTAVIPLLPVYGRDVLDAGPAGYGVLVASLAVGYLLGSLLMTASGDLHNKGVWLLVTAAVWDIGAVAFGFSRIFPLSALILLVMGVGGSMFVTLLVALIQQLTLHEMRGRMLGLYQMAFSAMPIGFVVGGALAQTISNEFALIFGAVMGTPVMLVLFLRVPALRSL